MTGFLLLCAALPRPHEEYHSVTLEDSGAGTNEQQPDNKPDAKAVETEELSGDPMTNPLAVIPAKVNGVSQVCISLNGEWQFTMDPDKRFWKNDTKKLT